MILDQDILNHAWLSFKEYTDPWSAFKAGLSKYLEMVPLPDMKTSELRNGHIRMDLKKHQVYSHDLLVKMTKREYELLRYFLAHIGEIVTHRAILTSVWNSSHEENRQSLRVFVGKLRAKIEEDPKNPKMIIVKQGVGYIMEKI